ncbi:RNA polymerase sigma factor [Sorangium sp. So ce233]|uniref:RNA polymerase sigma factor n=1 Tax=Sorangium sp. So ce233 TaxID=3133290 RepID=UPI003F5E7783
MESRSDNAVREKHRSFSVVHEVGAPFLRRMLRGYGVAPHDREDVLHDILLVAYRRLESFDASRLLRAALGARDDEEEDVNDEPVPLSRVLPYLAGLRARRAWDPLYRWLFGIAWRQLTHYRERAFRRREIPVGLQSSAIFAGVDRRPRLEQQVEAAERAEVIDALLASLLPERRVMLVMHDMLDIPVVEIARELQINENTAQNRLRLGREDFRAAVKRLGAEQRSALRPGDRPFAAEATTRRRPAPRRRGAGV